MGKLTKDKSNYRDLTNLAISTIKNWLPNESEHFFTFNNSLDLEYKDDYFLNLNDSESHELFSSIVHSMPVDKYFSTDLNLQLWREYEKIFYCGTIASEDFDDNSWKEYKADNTKEIKAYENFESLYQRIEKELLKNVSKTYEDSIITKLTNINEDWILHGYKREVENERKKYFSNGEYSYANQWSKWKSISHNINVASQSGLYGNYEIIDPNNSINSNLSTVEVTYSELKEALLKNYNTDEELKLLVRDIAQLRISFKIIDINIPGFEKEIFSSKWWKLKPQYVGKISIPSIIKKIILINKLEYVYRSKNIIEAGVRIFTEGIPKYKHLMSAGSGRVILAGFICEKLPKIPDPDLEKYNF